MKTFESRMRELVHTEMTSESPDGNGGSLQITETTIPVQSVGAAIELAKEADQLRTDLVDALTACEELMAELPTLNGFIGLAVWEHARKTLERMNE